MSETAQYAVDRTRTPLGGGAIITIIGTVLVAVFIAYGAGLDGELVGDSRELIAGNSLIKTPWSWVDIWTSNYWGEVLYAGNYRPITVWSLALNYSLNEAIGLHPENIWSYRLTNAFLHAGVVVAVHLLAGLWGVGDKGRWIAAIAFAWHPLHVEAVTNVVGRAECLAALAGIIFLYMHHLKKPVWAGVCILMALWSKESGIAFLAVAVWSDWCSSKSFEHRVLRCYGLYACVIGLWAVMRHFALPDSGPITHALDNPLVASDFWTRLRTVIAVQGEYVQLLVWPWGFSSDYSYAHFRTVGDWSDLRWMVPALALLGGGGGVWWLRTRVVTTAWGSYWLLVIPTANAFVLIGTIMGERLVYAPSIMAAIIWGWCGECALRSWPRTGAVLIAAVMIVWCLLCIQRGESWRDRETYHRTQLTDAPRSARAHLGLGSVHLEKGLIDSALHYFKSAVEIYPDYPEAHYNWGIGLSGLGHWAEAKERFERTVVLNASLYQAWYNLGLARHNTGDIEGAVLAYQKAVYLRHDDFETRYNLGIAYWQLGHWQEAMQSIIYACELRPDYKEGWVRLAELAARENNEKIERFARNKANALN